MEFLTDRLVLSPVEERDLAFYRRFLLNPALTRWLPVNEPCTEAEVRLHHTRRLGHWDRHGFGTWILRSVETGESVGYCGLEHVGDTSFVDLRYGLLKGAQGQGLALEAGRAVLSRGFRDLGLQRIYGASMHENIASVALLLALGMRLDAHFDLYGTNLFNASVDAKAFLKTL